MEAPKIIILEGISGCGKSTLHHLVSELSNYKDLVISRHTPSCWVYNMLYERRWVDYGDIERWTQYKTDVHVVWLCTEPNIARERKKAIEDDDKIECLESAHDLYDEYFRRWTFYSNVHVILNSYISIEETVKQIQEAIYGS